MINTRLLICFISVIIFVPALWAQDEYSNHSYYYGREYYVLRSGRAEMVVQADKAGLSPAFSYLMFDAENARQSARKVQAYNYTEKEKHFSSAVQVIMNGFTFDPLPQTCDTKWILREGIPSVHALWWASGVQIEETITPLMDYGLFIRNIFLTSKDLMATDTVYVNLSIPIEAKQSDTNLLVYERENAVFGMKVISGYTCRVDSLRHILVGPIVLEPNETTSLKVYLTAGIENEPDFDVKKQPDDLERNEHELISLSTQKWQHNNRISTTDELVQSIYDASRFSLPSSVANNGTMNAGIFEYGAQWVRDASNTALGMVHIGEFELTRSMLEYMLEYMIQDEGTTMISGGFDEPDREQFDQMGEFIHALKAYTNWTGDVSLLKQYKKKIIAMVERPLHENFRDETGMVHNRREFWERTFDDAYELAYQTWVITGLRDAASLAVHLDAEDRAAIWIREAAVIENAMFNHPSARLVDNGHLIKRRNTTQAIVDIFPYDGWVAGAPASVEQMSGIYPDATMALPIAMGLIDSSDDLAQKTIIELEKLWNRRWTFGGYERYNSSSQGDQPGPWTFATTFIMRGQHEAGRLDLSRRSLQWLYESGGGRTGSYYEHIPILKHAMPTAGILPWSNAEVSYFIIHHLLGVKFDEDVMTIKPNLFDLTAPIKADLRFRNSRIKLDISGSGKILHAVVNGIKTEPDTNGVIRLPADFMGGEISIICY